MRAYLRKIKNVLLPKSTGENTITLPDERYKEVKTSDLLPVSVCIPCYEMHGNGAIHLRRSLDMLSLQTWKNFEVVVSDHSKSDLIKDCCDLYKDTLTLNYLRNEEHRGSSCENANNAMDHAKNPLIRFLFQDDFLADESAMERASKYFTFTKAAWMATACNHRVDETGAISWDHYPVFFKDQVFDAINKLGCPSVILMRKNDVRYDKRLPALMDTDYYYRVAEVLGPPVIFNDINATIGIHAASVTNNGGFNDKIQVQKELEIVHSKYNKTKNLVSR